MGTKLPTTREKRQRQASRWVGKIWPQATPGTKKSNTLKMNENTNEKQLLDQNNSDKLFV